MKYESPSCYSANRKINIIQLSSSNNFLYHRVQAIEEIHSIQIIDLQREAIWCIRWVANTTKPLTFGQTLKHLGRIMHRKVLLCCSSLVYNHKNNMYKQYKYKYKQCKTLISYIWFCSFNFDLSH